MKQRRGAVILLLLALVGVLSLACLACGVAAWWVGRQGGLSGLLEPGPSGPMSSSLTRPGTGELRLAGDEPVTLDPALVQDSFSAAYVVEIYSGLVTLDRSLEVVPDLAERWEVSSDGRTYTFHLRQDARFQDGRPVTAADFKYSFERACSPALASPAASSYLGDIEGAVAVMRGQAREISGLRVLDEHTLTLTIDAPKAYFLAKLTYPIAFVVDRANVEAGANWTQHPNGSGPFRLAQWSSDKIVLERNAHYYGGQPALTRVTFVLSGGKPMTMYENGQLDLVEVGLEDMERVQDPSNPLSRELGVFPALDVEYLAMNVQRAPFDDLKVRQAIAQAIDRERLATVVLKGRVVAAQGILPPGLPGYSSQLQGLTFDPARARKSLSESRYKDAAHLPPIVLQISGEGWTMPPTIGAIVDMLHVNLGVDIRVEQVPWGTFLSELNEQRYAFFSSGWIADYPDPQDFLDLLFHSQSADNHMGYHNAEVDRLLEQARVEQDQERRLQLYQQAEALLVQDAVWVPLWHDRNYVLIKPYVKGVEYCPSVRPWLKDVYLAN